MTPQDAQFVNTIAVLIGPLVGAGAGSYFGLKGALNGLKESAKRAERFLESIRDTTRVALLQLEEHRAESRAAVAELRQQMRAP